MHSSYVVTDPEGTILMESGKMPRRSTTKLGKSGKPMKDKRGKIIYEPHRIKVLNTINFKNSMRYNPFACTHLEKDFLKLVTTLIANTKGFCTATPSGISTTGLRWKNRISPPLSSSSTRWRARGMTRSSITP